MVEWYSLLDIPHELSAGTAMEWPENTQVNEDSTNACQVVLTCRQSFRDEVDGIFWPVRAQ